MSRVALVLISLLFVSVSQGQDVEFVRGDCNGDGTVTVADAYHTMFFNIHGPPIVSFPTCVPACDNDGDSNIVGIIDGIYLFNFLLSAGSPAPPAPYPDCGVDPEPFDIYSCETYECSGPPPPLPDPAVTFRIISTGGSPGETIEVPCMIDTGDAPQSIYAWSFAVCHSGAVSPTGAGLGADAALLNDGEGPIFSFFHATDDGLGWVAGQFTGFSGSESFQPGSEYEVLRPTYDLLELGTATLDFCDGIGDPAAINEAVFFDGQHLTPLTEGAVIEVTPAFIRGDADRDGVFNGIVDAIWMLQYQFIPGAPTILCFDAADADDDGVYNGLLDGLRVLLFTFGSAEPLPPPGIGACGGDPTLDNLDCQQPPDACP